MRVSAEDGYKKTAERLRQVKVDLDRIASRQSALLSQFRQINDRMFRQPTSSSALMAHTPAHNPDRSPKPIPRVLRRAQAPEGQSTIARTA
jgi:hypothetical protein